MKLWFTRPSIPTCISRGVRGCSVWLKKPFFDATPRGPAAGRIYQHCPVGWRVIDDDGLDADMALSRTVAGKLEGYDDVQWALWDAMCVSICGRVQRDGWIEAWEAAAHGYVEDENFKDGCDSFLFECDVPPALWFQVALSVGDNEVACAWSFLEQVWYWCQEIEEAERERQQ